MVHEPVDGRERHGRVDEDLAPLRERRVGGDGEALSLVAFGDQLEEHRGFALIAPDVAQVVEHQQIEPVELCELLGQAQLPPCRLQALHEVTAASEEDAAPRIDQRMPERAREMALADAWRTEQEDVGAAVEPLVPLGQRHHLRLGDGRHRREVEAREPLVGTEPGLGPVAVELPALESYDAQFLGAAQ